MYKWNRFTQSQMDNITIFMYLKNILGIFYIVNSIELKST